MRALFGHEVPGLKARRARSAVAALVFGLCAGTGVFLLIVLLLGVWGDGKEWLTMDFLTNFPSRFPSKAGLKSALFGSFWIGGIVLAVAVPLGVGAAVYLEEYARKGRLSSFIELNIANLAGVPSIIYGILGLTVFARGFGLDRSVITGGLTLSLLVLPTVILAAREALRAVPNSLRRAAQALGATRWQTVRHHVLPSALPGILTGVILSLSRAMGEAAPLIMIGALTYVAFIPEKLTDPFTALPIQIFNWAGRPNKDFHGLAAAGILVLLVVLLSLNATAILLRNRAERKVRW